MSLRPQMPRRTPAADHAILELDGRKVAYRVVASKKAEKMRIRIGLDGVDVIRPNPLLQIDVAKQLARPPVRPAHHHLGQITIAESESRHRRTGHPIFQQPARASSCALLSASDLHYDPFESHRGRQLSGGQNQTVGV